jgi:hypothetical protein
LLTPVGFGDTVLSGRSQEAMRREGVGIGMFGGVSAGGGDDGDMVAAREAVESI